MKNCFNMIILFIMVYSCYSDGQLGVHANYSNGNEIMVYELDPRSTVNLDSIYQEVKYVYLETTENSIIGQVDEIIVTNDNIFILDKYQSASIFIFNRDGEFLHKIHRLGKGPGEYSQPADIAVLEEKQELYLMNSFPRKIIKYNFSGHFIGEINLPIRFTSFTVSEVGDIILVNEPNCRRYGNPPNHPREIMRTLYIMTTDGKSISTGISVNVKFEENSISKSNFGIMKNQKISFHPVFNDTIYKLEGKEVTPIINLDFTEHKIDDDMVAGLNKDQFHQMGAEKDFYYIVGQHTIAENVISFFLFSSRQAKSYYAIFDQNSQNFMIFYAAVNSIFNPCNLISKTAWEDYFVSLVSIEQLNEIKDVLNVTKNIPKEHFQFTPPRELLDRIDENSNPVLAFYKLRPEKINMESVYLE